MDSVFSHKKNYIERLKQLHQSKTGVLLDDVSADEMFEKLIVLVDTITKDVNIKKISYGRRN